ncbi:MAG: molybdopterin synthase sulfur carrier subunit [Candidatus Nitrosopolaris wilkensis]|nr:MAG: molybdopterin synthase sulfur carrier subunit [Candidatus Nitrosopolaris wilkensis]
MKRAPRIENKAISTIKVNVLYFAQVREATGIGAEEVILVKDSNVNNLISKIEENHPSILRLKENIQLAVNCNIGCKNLSLKEGDQIAVFPPVAGG